MNATATRTRRPGIVTIAGLLHILIAAAFLSIPLIGLLYGADVRAAADAEAARQGVTSAALAAHGLSFTENGVAIAVPVAAALALAILGLLNLAGKRAARIVSWIVLPLVLLGNIAIMISNANATETVRAVLAKSGDPALQRVDAKALLDAAGAAYPGWVEYLTDTRNAVVMLGALLAIVLLALPAARAHFRK